MNGHKPILRFPVYPQPVASGPFLRAAVVGLVGSVILGYLLRDVIAMVFGMAIVGVAVGLVSSGRPGIAGLGVGQLASLIVLVAIQFGTTVDTFINSEDVPQFIGLLPLILVMWLGFLCSAVIGFLVGSRVLTPRRLSEP